MSKVIVKIIFKFKTPMILLKIMKIKFNVSLKIGPMREDVVSSILQV